MSRARTPELDETAIARESPVRQAHAAAARRHGRASAPGYLGLPIEEAGDAELEELQEREEERSDDDEEHGQDDEQRGEDDERPRTRGEASSRSRGEDESAE